MTELLEAIETITATLPAHVSGELDADATKAITKLTGKLNAARMNRANASLTAEQRSDRAKAVVAKRAKMVYTPEHRERCRQNIQKARDKRMANLAALKKEGNN